MSKLACPLMKSDTKNFCCGNPSIENQIRDSYFITLLKQAYGHQIMIDQQVIGYYMLYFKNVNLHIINQIMGEDYESNMLDYYMAAHIRYIAIDQRLQHKSIGTYVLKGLIDSILKMSQNYPIRMITLDALQEYHNWYKSIGFRDIPGVTNDGITIPMFIDCMTEEDVLKLNNYCYNSI